MPSTRVSMRVAGAHTELVPDDAHWTDPVVVPDDISALQPDIDAYHRELRQAARRRRWHGALDGTRWRRWALPLGIVATALLLSGVVTAILTFAGPRAGPTQLAQAPVAPAPRAAVGQVEGLLPDVTLTDDAGTSMRARSLRPALFALVPPSCRCTALLSDLAGQAYEVDVPLVVVAPARQDAEVSALAGQLHRGRLVAAFDANAALATAYAASGVTVLVVAPDATVTYVQRDVTAGTRLELELLDMVSPPPGLAARPQGH